MKKEVLWGELNSREVFIFFKNINVKNNQNSIKNQENNALTDSKEIPIIIGINTIIKIMIIFHFFSNVDNRQIVHALVFIIFEKSCFSV